MKQTSRMLGLLKYVMLFVITFMLLINVTPNKSYACSCAEPGSVQEERDRSTAVFSGKVLERTDLNKNNVFQSSGDPIAYLFQVGEIWKGIDETEVIVYSVRDGASCGYQFTANREYLVYAKENNGELWASFCSRTTSLVAAKTDLQELGEGKIPTNEVSLVIENPEPIERVSTETETIFKNQQWLIWLSAGLFIVIVWIVVRRKKRHS